MLQVPEIHGRLISLLANSLVLQLFAVAPQEKKLAEAVRSLRATLNETQQQFSDRLGVVVRTVTRYEVEKPPSGDILLTLSKIAGEAGRSDLAEAFDNAYSTVTVSTRTPLAEAIRRFRLTFGETQEEFADRTGLSVSTIARYETSARPSDEALKRLSELARESKLPKYAAIFKGDEAAAATQQQQEAVVLLRLLELKVDQLKTAVVASRPDAVRHARIAHAALSAPQSVLAELEKVADDQLSRTDDVVTKTCSVNDLILAAKRAREQGDMKTSRTLEERAHKLAIAIPPKERLR
jgi:transcriptional regulator with XRE-family HTH domain